MHTSGRQAATVICGVWQKLTHSLPAVLSTQVGATLAKGDTFGSVESVKAASSVYAPVGGTVQSVNQAVKDDNSLVNTSADKDGWMIKVKLADAKELEALLDQAAYDKLVADSKH